MENLVGDVRKMTYTNMPATLAASKSLRPAGAQQKQGTQGAGKGHGELGLSNFHKEIVRNEMKLM